MVKGMNVHTIKKHPILQWEVKMKFFFLEKYLCISIPICQMQYKEIGEFTPFFDAVFDIIPTCYAGQRKVKGN